MMVDDSMPDDPQPKGTLPAPARTDAPPSDGPVSGPVGGAGRRVHVVVTGAKSRAHLVYVASYLRTLLTGSAGLRVSFVEAPAFLAADAVTVEDARRLLPQDERLTVEPGLPEWRFEAGARAVYVAVGAPGLKASLALRRANPVRRIECVVTDEGIGTYGSFASRREAITRQGVPTSRAVLRAALVQTSVRLLTTRRWAAYEHGDTGWRVNPHVADEFTRDLAGATPGATRAAVILTQPFVDLGLVDEPSYLAYVEGLARAARRAGFDPVVRPHPAERPGRYDGMPTSGGVGPAELDPAVVSASLVLGGPSTAMVNLAAMTRMPVVWASEPSLAYLDREVSRDQRAVFEAFLGAPCDPARVDEAIATVLRRGGGPSA